MKTKIRSRALGALLLAGLLANCGGGGGGGGATPTPPPSPPPTGGITRNGVAVGPISNFGSVIVNGVTYNTDSASFAIDGQPGLQSDLQVGDVVAVIASINGTTGAATATQVLFDDAVTGPVQSKNIASNSLLVLGQTVLVTLDTSFDDSFGGTTLDAVNVGQVIEVTGQFDASGNIVATRLEPKPAATEFEVHGTVAALDTGAMTFTLGALVVDYAQAILDNFPGGQISNGDLVEAKSGTTLGAGGEMLASKVELETFVPGGEDGDFLEIEGFITRFVSASDFDVAGFPVTTDGSTTFTGGVAADLGLNIKVEVDGNRNANGVLVATKVDIRPAKAVRVEALVDSSNPGNGTLVVLGITVTTDELTRFEDKSNADQDPLTINQIVAGNYVEVRGDEFPAGSGQIRATILEREDTDPDTRLQGFVETISNPALTILGVTIETNGSTVFRDENDAPITSSDFFNRLTANDLVKATGAEVTDTTIVATQVEFELEF